MPAEDPIMVIRELTARLSAIADTLDQLAPPPPKPRTVLRVVNGGSDVEDGDDG